LAPGEVVVDGSDGGHEDGDRAYEVGRGEYGDEDVAEAGQQHFEAGVGLTDFGSRFLSEL
jgi:hypothetical protein